MIYEANYFSLEEALANLRLRGFKTDLSIRCNELFCSRYSHFLDSTVFDRIEEKCFGGYHQYFTETIIYGQQAEYYRVRRSVKPPEKRFEHFRVVALIHPLSASAN